MTIEKCSDGIRQELIRTGWPLAVVDEARQILGCILYVDEYIDASIAIKSKSQIILTWNYLDYWYFDGAPLSVQIALWIGLTLKLLFPPSDKTQRIKEFKNFFYNKLRLKEAISKSEIVGGWIFPGEPELLWDYVSETCNIPGDICEIGSWTGRSTIIIASAINCNTPYKKLHVVDDWSFGGKEKLYPSLNENRNVKAEFDENLSPWLENIIIHEGCFHQVQPMLINQVHPGFCFIFYDAEHTELELERDLLLIPSLLHNNGVLVIHDYNSKRFVGAKHVIDTWISTTPGLKLERTVNKCAVIRKTL